MSQSDISNASTLEKDEEANEVLDTSSQTGSLEQEACGTDEHISTQPSTTKDDVSN